MTFEEYVKKELEHINKKVDDLKKLLNPKIEKYDKMHTKFSILEKVFWVFIAAVSFETAIIAHKILIKLIAVLKTL